MIKSTNINRMTAHDNKNVMYKICSNYFPKIRIISYPWTSEFHILVAKVNVLTSFISTHAQNRDRKPLKSNLLFIVA